MDDQQPQLQLIKLYVKDLSFSVPEGADIFKAEWRPELAFNIQTEQRVLEENTFDVKIKITCKVNCADKTAFSLGLTQAGIFTLLHFKEESLQHALNVFCPNLLYPYLREAISATVLHAGFPQLNLSSINFDAMYHERLKQQGGATIQ